MNIRHLTPLIVLIFCISSCSNEGKWQHAAAKESDLEATAAADTTTTATGDVMPLNATERKIIKKAAMRCRVNDVFKATTGIEHLVINAGGQVTESNLENESAEYKTLPYSPDSLIQMQRFTTVANLTLKVPVQQLDSVLMAIAAQSSFINNRSLNLEDVTLRYLSNQLKSQAVQVEASAQKANELAKKSSDVLATGSYVAEKQEANIDRKIENLDLKERTVYASLQIALYQPARVEKLIVANTDQLMRPSFFGGFTSAVSSGWQFLLELLLLMIGVWPLALIAVIAVIIYRRARMKRKPLPQLHQ